MSYIVVCSVSYFEIDMSKCVLKKLSDVILLYPPLLHPAAPKNINYETVKEDLGKIDGVKQAHSLHIWSLTLNKIALAAHLVLGEGNLRIFLA